MKKFKLFVIALSISTSFNIMALSANMPVVSIQSVLKDRSDLNRLNQLVSTSTEIISMEQLKGKDILTVDQRALLRQTWNFFITIHTSLYQTLSELSIQEKMSKGKLTEEQFTIGMMAYMSTYKNAVLLINKLKNIPTVDDILNEERSGMDYKLNSFYNIKSMYLNFKKMSEFKKFKKAFRQYRFSTYLYYLQIDEDLRSIEDMLNDNGTSYSLKNKQEKLGKNLFDVFYPIKKGVSEWFGDTRVHDGEKYLVSEDHINLVSENIEFGDIIIERKNWFLSNLALPGFWKHSLIYIGTKESRRELDLNVEVQEWVRGQGILSGSFEELLRKKYPIAYAKSIGHDSKGRQSKVLEAVSEGVVFSSLEHAITSDSIVILRPHLSKLDIAKSIYTSYSYVGRPYDFNFTMNNDSELFCSELIYYSYQPTALKNGINFDLDIKVGKKVVTPNDMVKQFVKEYANGIAQFDLVLFLDGSYDDGNAKKAGVEDLKATWNRPKWHKGAF